MHVASSAQLVEWLTKLWMPSTQREMTYLFKVMVLKLVNDFLFLYHFVEALFSPSGCGPVGLFAVAIAKAMGATKVSVDELHHVQWCFKAMIHLTSRMACDIFDSKLEAAKKVGADVTINCKTTNLREAGE